MFSRPALSLVLLVASGGTVSAQVNVTTYHNDTLRTGWNKLETVLTPTSVAGPFGVLAQTTLDEQVDAQPLVLTTPGLTAVYVVTENNTVYEIDATTGAIRASVNLGMPVPMSALPGKCVNNSANVGITSTPVIDATVSPPVMYVVTYTLESSVPVYRIRELSLPSLSQVANVVITALHPLSDGTINKFAPASQRQRAALLEANGNIYAAFASFCDAASNVSRGWVLGWKRGTLTPLPANELTDTQTAAQVAAAPRHNLLSSIWSSGYGIATDANGSGNLFFSTSNSDEVRTDNIQESAVKMSSTLATVEDYFTPYTFATLDSVDEDFGAGGLMVLPNQPGPVPHLAVTAGKSGIMYIMNRDTGQMGGFVSGGPDKPSRIKIAACWCGPSYFAGADGIGRVVTSGGRTLETWKVNTANPTPLTVEAQGSVSVSGGQDAGFFTSISSNGTQAGSAVIWAVSRPTSTTNTDVLLYAFNASATATKLPKLYSGIAGTWPHLGANANIVPTVANGKVYVASFKLLSIFGPNPPASPTVEVAATVQPEESVAAVPGEAQIFGTITSVDGDLIGVRLRGGRTISVDLTDAANQGVSVIPLVGENVIVTGTLAPDGSLAASAMLRAKEPATWGPDKP